MNCLLNYIVLDLLELFEEYQHKPDVKKPHKNKSIGV